MQEFLKSLKTLNMELRISEPDNDLSQCGQHWYIDFGDIKLGPPNLIIVVQKSNKIRLYNASEILFYPGQKLTNRFTLLNKKL